MAAMMFQNVRDLLILPYVNVKLIKFDLNIKNRVHTLDKVTQEAVKAINYYRVGVKCSTLTPDESTA